MSISTINYDILDDPKFNAAVREDIKRNIIEHIDDSDLAAIVISSALAYLCACVKTNDMRPWDVLNKNAFYLSDYWDEPTDDDAIELWELTHPGHKMP